MVPAMRWTELAFCVWWRQFAGGIFALLLAAPLNMLLKTSGVDASWEDAVATELFVTGPIILKMLVANPFTGFPIEAERPCTCGAKNYATDEHRATQIRLWIYLCSSVALSLQPVTN